MDLLCNMHYVGVEDCGHCLLFEELEKSLFCCKHLHSIIICKDCIRIIYEKNYFPPRH